MNLSRADLDRDMAMLADRRAGASIRALVESYHMSDYSIKTRLAALDRTAIPTPRPKRQVSRRCRRCGILLAKVAGSGRRYCGLCIEEQRGIYQVSPGGA